MRGRESAAKRIAFSGAYEVLCVALRIDLTPKASIQYGFWRSLMEKGGKGGEAE